MIFKLFIIPSVTGSQRKGSSESVAYGTWHATRVNSGGAVVAEHSWQKRRTTVHYNSPTCIRNSACHSVK